MLVLRLEIWPGGSRQLRRTIGEVRIANVSDLAAVSDYDLTYTPYNDAGHPLPMKHRHAEVSGHARKDGAWSLVKKALVALGLTLAACDPPPRAPKPYEAVVLQPFSMEEAEKSCPAGYEIVHREYCRDNRQLESATIVCRQP